MTPDQFETALAACATETEAFLDAWLTPAMAPWRLVAAMRHGTLNGGKRLRPFLVRASAQLFEVPPAQSLAAGAALEMVHCYSLIHDDLPDMDNDEMRRGSPTVWKAFDPALAILAGDALLTEAFRVLASENTHPEPAIRIRLVSILANAAGSFGMVGGQVLDIEGEKTPLSDEQVMVMQDKKTGALIHAAIEMGTVLGQADGQRWSDLVHYAHAAGIAFQLADDILDATATTERLGKTAGKDLAQNKSTFVARHGIDAARRRLGAIVIDGLACLDRFGPEADPLRHTIRYFAVREH